MKKIESIGADSGTDVSTINLNAVAEMTSLFSGAELEQLVKDSLFLAFKDGARPLTTDDLLTVSKRTYPLAITMKEDIAALRKFAHNRAQPADGEDIVSSIDDIPEEENPFGE